MVAKYAVWNIPRRRSERARRRTMNGRHESATTALGDDAADDDNVDDDNRDDADADDADAAAADDDDDDNVDDEQEGER